MIKKILTFFKSRFETKPKVDHPIEKVFTIEGTNYYEFKDISKIPCIRAFTKSDVFAELDMRCSRDYLIKHTEATDKLLNNSKQINITQVAQLNQQLKERLEMIYEVDIIYKIASVVFFDKTENPYEYDDLYAREKIEKFKRYARKVDGFFFDTLFKSLIPTKSINEEDLRTYMIVGAKMSQMHSDNISTILFNTNGTKDLVPS